MRENMAKKKTPPTANIVLPDDIDELKALATKLHTDLTTRTEQRDNLSNWCEELKADLDVIQYDEILKRERAEHDIMIRRKWSLITSEVHGCLLRLCGQFPSPIDARV